ncbi:phosphatidylglycerol lysyltransferase domain-containing protein [Clostridium aestuarii]|uniref:Phosphatidylglycerol lysyltransferase domain-containing protein n=1 Tax=Clostridium aestuarii TaxID=338193 RepID=A0ABT4D365_9CLOT|nr:phosphatidylglycerol lysyltransferase domain-containing protein [Clostridium aestuarii]MCY6485092.1 phosphatidylglycerol lysyltransferase domain-containing protein [Clostridium aestuarii]
MLQFKTLDIDDRAVLNRYLKPYKFLSCEYSFATLFMWKDACDIQYSIYKDTLIIKKKDFEGKYYFIQPIGYNDNELMNLVEVLRDYKEKNNMDYLFSDLERQFVKKVKDLYKKTRKDFKVCKKESKDNFDYIYDAKNLIELSGKKYHKKKNHYNAFVKKYDYRIEDILDKQVIFDCIRAAEIWYERKEEKNKILIHELNAIKEILKYMDELELKGLVVYVDNSVQAFSIGEKVNDKMAIIHIEKANADIRGIYSFISRTFIKRYFNDISLINREEDMGLAGLRKSKMSYRPIKFAKKYILDF